VGVAGKGPATCVDVEEDLNQRQVEEYRRRADLEEDRRRVDLKLEDLVCRPAPGRTPKLHIPRPLASPSW
jgi:hypothetical protein